MSMFEQLAKEKGVDLSKETSLDIDLLVEFASNDVLFDNSEEMVQGMKDSIKLANGLYQPIIIDVEPLENGDYNIIGGHRRIKALKELFNEGFTDFVYNDKPFNKTNIPVTFLDIKVSDDEIKELESHLGRIISEEELNEYRELKKMQGVINTNSYRTQRMEEKVVVFEELSNTYKGFKSLGVKLGVNEQQFICSSMGISQSNYYYVRNIVEGNEEKNKPVEKREEEHVVAPNLTEKKITANDVIKELKNLVKVSNKLSDNVSLVKQRDFSTDEVLKISETLNEVTELLNSITIKKD